MLVDPTNLAPVVFVTGKGGVGKTTIGAGLALAARKRGDEAVFIEFSDGRSGARAFGEHKDAVERIVIQPDSAVMKASEPLFGSSLLTRIALGNFAMKSFLGAAPAIRELAILALINQIRKKNPAARLVVDMPATGHSLAWLRIAAQGRDLVRRGPLYDLCVELTRDLVAPGKCSVVVVSLPERMVLQETLELCQSLQSEVGLTAARLVINRVPPSMPDGALAEARQLVGQPGEIGLAAQRTALVIEQRIAISEDLLHTLRGTLGSAADVATLLPRLACDPNADLVADWLIQRGAA